jgi:hypothetical protein
LAAPAFHYPSLSVVPAKMAMRTSHFDDRDQRVQTTAQIQPLLGEMRRVKGGD